MQYHRIYARIDIDAILHNLGECKRRIPEGTKVLAVIKADGYGHGAVELAHQLESEVDYFGVAVIEEAVELRRAGIKKPILILGYTSPSQDDLLINYDITQNIYTYDMAKRLSDRAVALGKTIRFHIGLDTGMSRVGFQDNDESVEQIKKIVKLPNLVLEGIFSHYARQLRPHFCDSQGDPHRDYPRGLCRRLSARPLFKGQGDSQRSVRADNRQSVHGSVHDRRNRYRG